MSKALKTLGLVAMAIVALAVGAFGMLMTAGLVNDFLHGLKRKWVAREIKQTYRLAAARGELPQPGTNSDAFYCYSVCYYSLPRSVSVTTSGGDKFYYHACETTNASGSQIGWHFVFGFATDSAGNAISNFPSNYKTANR